jgi:lipoprotein NlpI
MPRYAETFNNRGNAFFGRGDLTHAIADYGEAIRRNPNYTAAYGNHGNALTEQGALDRAIADYSAAIRLDPSGPDAFGDRGRAYFQRGDFAAAAADLAASLRLKPEDAYGALWQHLAAARVDKDAAARALAANAAALKREAWPYPVIELFLARRSPERTLRAARKPDERCEAVFYIGEWHLLRDERAEAVPHLKDAAATCPKNFIEYTGALAELRQLGK